MEKTAGDGARATASTYAQACDQGGARTSFRFDLLPGEVFDSICACLLGDELIRLSNVNQRLLVDLLGDAAIWSARIGHHESLFDGVCALSVEEGKREYMRAKSLLFSGTDTSTTTKVADSTTARGAAVPTVSEPSHTTFEPPIYDGYVVSILPSEAGKYDGGILVGSQSIPSHATDRWAENHQQFVYMDTDRTLYCSVLGHDEVVAEKLDCERWYHLALAFDGGEQSVYLNGSLVRQTHGSMHHEWRYLHYTQLGTGCMSGASVAKLTPGFNGWYAFHGIIDEFRLWKRALALEEVDMLTNGLPLKLTKVEERRGARMAPMVSEASSSARHAMPCALSGLPREVFDAVTTCLTGWDLLLLACVNRHLHEELLAQPAIWSTRLQQPHDDDTVNVPPSQKLTLKMAKANYASVKSFRFRGQNVDEPQTQGERGACIELLRFLPSSSNRHGQLFVPLAPQRFTFDVWFSVSSTLDRQAKRKQAYPGGIILGAQSARWQDAMVWADYHQQFIHVDPDLNLYCTVVGDKSAIASPLATYRWYHLALVFDVDEEHVYLNGQLVRTTQGRLHRDWRSLYFMQLGTGCISAGSVGTPSPKFAGWYAFNGMIDDFRMWDDALDAKAITALASDCEIKTKPAGAMRACDKSTHLGPVEQARCSRPREGACVTWR